MVMATVCVRSVVSGRRGLGKVQRRGFEVRARASLKHEEGRDGGGGGAGRIERRDVLKGGSAAAVAAAVVGLSSGMSPEAAQALPELPSFLSGGDSGNKPEYNVAVGKHWEQVSLPLEDGVILLDVGFCPGEPEHGFLVGTRQTLLETTDGGKTWEARFIGNKDSDDDDGINYRFNAIAWGGSDGREGWIVGKPAVMFHTTDAGSTWTNVPLSNKLPGTPLGLYAYPEDGKVEMVTDQGAIYLTENGAESWKAQVQETVDATLNRTVSSGISGASFYTGTFATIRRNNDGGYVAVNSRGNFFMTWQPGEDYWQPHNRSTARRLQNMGWKENTMWMLTRGGNMYFGARDGFTEDFEEQRIGSRGFGLLDVAFRNKTDAWASGGSGSLFHSTDGGVSWKRERQADNLSGNLYLIRFFGDNNDKGFVLGSDSVLLRYTL